MENLNDFKLLTVKDVAEMLNLSKYSIYMMVYRDSIPYVKIGRTNRSVRFNKDKIIACCQLLICLLKLTFNLSQYPFYYYFAF